MLKTIITPIVLILLYSPSSFGAHSRPEKYYQAAWCSERNGQIEVRLPDGTRADCITDTHAIEFDFGPKWTEATGQALYYSLQTGKRAGIVLILEDDKDYKYWLRLNSTIRYFHLPIDTWKVSR
jgi:hypothetical protein